MIFQWDQILFVEADQITKRHTKCHFHFCQWLNRRERRICFILAVMSSFFFFAFHHCVHHVSHALWFLHLRMRTRHWRPFELKIAQLVIVVAQLVIVVVAVVVFKNFFFLGKQGAWESSPNALWIICDFLCFAEPIGHHRATYEKEANFPSRSLGGFLPPPMPTHPTPQPRPGPEQPQWK